jgi:hypothetical protein
MRISLIAALGAVALLLAGCVPVSSSPVRTPTPTVGPIFASEEEALAAAEDAYREYLAVSDAILHDGGADADRLDRVAVGAALGVEKRGFEEFERAGLKSTGSTVLTGLTLQTYERDLGDGTDIVRVYVCTDVSGVDVIDSFGKSVVSSNRPTVTTFEVGFDMPSVNELLVSSKVVWTGAGVCD